jgi:hypothetical protein
MMPIFVDDVQKAKPNRLPDKSFSYRHLDGPANEGEVILGPVFMKE